MSELLIGQKYQSLPLKVQKGNEPIQYTMNPAALGHCVLYRLSAEARFVSSGWELQKHDVKLY